METVVLIYFISMNLFGLYNMYRDKQRAIKRQYRIPEKQLFFVSVIGGSLGSWIGMYLFHHKTKHWYFVLGMPLIVLIHILVLFLALHYHVVRIF